MGADLSKKMVSYPSIGIFCHLKTMILKTQKTQLHHGNNISYI